MKLKKIAIALTAASAVTAAHASIIDNNGTGILTLSGFGTNETDGGALIGVSALAIVSDCKTRNAFQRHQLGASNGCVGQPAAICAPNISSAEFRALVQSPAITDTAALDSGLDIASEGDLNSCTTANSVTTNSSSTIQFDSHDGVEDGIRAHAGSGDVAIGGVFCGPGPALAPSFSRGNDNSTLNYVRGGTQVRFGVVHAQALADTNDRTDIGFYKLDGSVPSLANLMSNNYNLVSNLHDSGAAGSLPASGTYHGMTVGAAPASGGIAYHNVSGGPRACGPLRPGSDPVGTTNTNDMLDQVSN